MASDIWRWIGDEKVLIDLVASLSLPMLFLVVAAATALLLKSADSMIEGVVQLTRRTGIPSIVVGATVVSLGTTTPEMFVSVTAAWMGNPGLALGNGVGSIICDTGLILGITCLLVAMPANRYILNRTGWVQVGAATLLVLIAVGSLLLAEGEPVLQRWVGFLLLTLLLGYLGMSYLWARRLGNGQSKKYDSPIMSIGRSSLLVFLGLVGVAAGSRILVPCASEIARRLGVPEDIIAATLVALGTSLPELITAITAVRKGHPEITLGNIVGADVLNCLFVIGAAAAARPLAVPGTFFTFHFPAMILILYSFRVFIFINRDGRFRRWQGGWLVAIYVAYVALQYILSLGMHEGG